jgi:hypothetical protein
MAGNGFSIKNHYHQATLSAHLAQPEAINLLDQLRLPHELHELIAELRRRWYENGTICHEVGILLGYPIKDVAGYIGIWELPRTGSCGWCVYGSPELSLVVYRRFKNAEKRAFDFLNKPLRGTSQKAA